MKTGCDTATRMRKPATVVQQHAPQGPPRSCGERRRDGPASLNPIHRKRLEGIEPVHLPFHYTDQRTAKANNTGWRPQRGTDKTRAATGAPGVLLRCLLTRLRRVPDEVSATLPGTWAHETCVVPALSAWSYEHAGPHRPEPGLELVIAPPEVTYESLPADAVSRGPRQVAALLL